MSKKTLKEEIQEFQKNKKRLVHAIIVLGVIGLFLPVLPGVALLFLGFLLLFPRQGEDFLKKIRQTIRI